MKNTLKKWWGGRFHCEISKFIIAVIIKAQKRIQHRVKLAFKVYMSGELLNT